MNTLEAIKTRRSIRKFNSKPIPQVLLHEVIAAAMYAPSAWNEQPWHFIVIDDPTLLNKIPLFSPHAEMCKHAPVSILICADLRMEKAPGFWVQDCSAATQNLLLAIHEKGLGAVWTGVYPVEERIQGFRTLLKLTKEIVPFSFVVLGYSAQKLSPQERFRKDRIHHNGW